MRDKEIERLIKLEEKRQKGAVNLIASENYVSKDVLSALGSVFTNKYAEGYPGKRYYGGNEVVDKVENLAKTRALKLFKLSKNPPSASRRSGWGVNVQPYSGSPANLAVYLALVPLGEKIMGMSLSMGGHLTHGHSVSVTGKLWKWAHFGVDKKTELLDYDEIRKMARREKPKLIVVGFTAYSRIIDFQKLRKIADEAGALLMIDMSHFAGLVAGGVYPPPFPYADVVTTTTHKTLRGPRSAIIFSRLDLSVLINKAVFPGLQGGPHVNQIAAVAVCLEEAMASDFKRYARQIVKNTKTLALSLSKRGWRIISGGTDSHLFLVDTWMRGISGKTAEELLGKKGIIVNKNTIPYDARSPFDPSGIRIGTAAVTTMGLKEKDMMRIAGRIDDILKAL
ncbi:MAG: serine hydroxymethyltransferase [bacterium]|nr:serine hydroxymethyltransferase [bacterium]